MAQIQDLGPQIHALLTELKARAKACKTNWQYLDGSCPIPQAITTAKLTKAYNALMPMSNAPWASLVVDSVQDRLEVGGIRTGDEDMDKAIWRGVWQANALDAESKLGHQGTLTNGRVFATVWPDAGGQPEVVLDSAEQMIVQYREGRHQPRHRVAALRHWKGDDEREYLTLYRADGLYKFQASKEQTANDGRVKACDTWWEQREETGRDGQPESWPLANPFGVVPVVEIATNRRLKAGGFPYARGEFSHCLGLLDRINLLTFLGLVVAVWMGFPLRGVTGDPISRRVLVDDEGAPLLDSAGRERTVAEPPFESRPDSVVQFENPDAKVWQLEAADRKNLSIFPELSQLAYVTKTPAHYFPLEQGMSNISADAIRALEGGLHAKVDGIHKPFIGEGWEEVTRVGGLMLPEEIIVPREAAIWWLNKESRSLAEQADAAVKLKDILPATFIAEKYLSLTQEEIIRIQADAAGSALDTLLRQAAAGANGNGNVAPVAG